MPRQVDFLSFAGFKALDSHRKSVKSTYLFFNIILIFNNILNICGKIKIPIPLKHSFLKITNQPEAAMETELQFVLIL